MQRAALGTGIAFAHRSGDSINSASVWMSEAPTNSGVEADFFNFKLERFAKLKASNSRRDIRPFTNQHFVLSVEQTRATTCR